MQTKQYSQVFLRSNCWLTLSLSFIIYHLSFSSAGAQVRWNQQFQDYIDEWSPVAIEEMNNYGIPASITLAQGLLESGAGSSELARKGNNHFGIKCHNGWTGPTVYFDDDQRNDCFRKYRNARESFEDHSKFLAGGQRYRSLFSLKVTDYKGWAHGLKKAGYATNPRYADHLIELIEVYKLYSYDSGKHPRPTTQHPTSITQYYTFNDRLYVLARRGDTFRTLAEETGISRRKLARYNERDKDDALVEGEIIWLEKKARKAPKEYKNRPHVVQAGESMYSIAQYYGIRLKRLYKMNDLTPDYVPRVGDRLRVR